MDDYAIYLAEEAKSDIAALHQFRVLYDEKASAFHFFFEGEEDSLFYMAEARRRLYGRVTHVYDCGGKRSVVNVRESIAAEGYLLTKCLFFVDRDYDDYLGQQVVVDENTYITDGYSIENEVVGQEGAEILLADFIRLSRADPEFIGIVSALTHALLLFQVRVRPLIAWILAAKAAGLKPNLKNTDGLKKVGQIGVAADFQISHEGFARFRRYVLPVGVSPPFTEVLAWRRRLDLASANLWIRGKYDIWFFHGALIRLIEESGVRRKSSGGVALRIPASVREGRYFEMLGGRLAPPSSLAEFLALKLN